MKRIFFIASLILILQNLNVNAAENSLVFSNDNKTFGLKDVNGTVLAEPVYRKIIMLGDNAYIIQNKKYRYGIADKSGNILVEPKYRNADRVLGKYVKLGNVGNYGLYDENGKTVIPPEYDSLDVLFGGMMLTYKDYYYGISDFKGNVILENKFDDIYMPKPNIMRIQYKGKWYEIEQVTAETLTLPEDITEIRTNENYKVSDIIVSTGAVSGYSVLTFTDYLIKMISSVSPAHEAAIDELMLSQGAETVNILLKFSWLPKYPYTYIRNYYKTVRNPNNGPLSDMRIKLKQKI